MFEILSSLTLQKQLSWALIQPIVAGSSELFCFLTVIRILTKVIGMTFRCCIPPPPPLISDAQILRTCIQNRLLYTLNMEKCWLNIPKQNIFWDAKILAIQTYFIIIKIGFI